jgi:hypothetical protein
MDEKTYTRVIFKMTPNKKTAGGIPLNDSECIAFLMDVPANTGCIMSYMHVGQHGEASLDFVRECKPATPEQYADLKNELENLVGYELDIRHRMFFGRSPQIPLVKIIKST